MNQVVVEIQARNREYNGGRLDEPKVFDGISFWRVGHNASHEFYAGVGVNGRLYRYSAGEDPEEEAEFEKLLPTLRTLPEAESLLELERFQSEVRRKNTHVVESFQGYYGHL